MNETGAEPPRSRQHRNPPESGGSAVMPLRKGEGVISAAQVREALALLGWAPQRLATLALVTFDEAAAAQDDVGIRDLGGLQRGLIRGAFEAAGIELLSEGGSARARLLKVGTTSPSTEHHE